MATAATLRVNLEANIAQFLDGTKRAGLEIERLREQADKAQFREWRAAMRDGESLLRSLRTPAQVYADEIARLNNLLRQGAIDQETFARATRRAGEEMRRAKQQSGPGGLAGFLGGTGTTQSLVTFGAIGIIATAADAMARKFAAAGDALKDLTVEMARGEIAAKDVGVRFAQMIPAVGPLARGITSFADALAGWSAEAERAKLVSDALAKSQEQFVAIREKRASLGPPLEASQAAAAKELRDELAKIDPRAPIAMQLAIERQARAIYDLRMQRAKDADESAKQQRMQEAANESWRRGSAEASRLAAEVQKQADAREALRQKGRDFIEGIDTEIATFGMAAREAALYRLALAGVSDNLLIVARSRSAHLAALERERDAAKDIKKVYDETRTPLEKTRAELERLVALRRAGLDSESFRRAVGGLFKGRESGGEVTFGATLAQSADAFSAIVRSQTTARTRLESLTEEELNVIRDVARNTGALLEIRDALARGNFETFGI